MAGIIVVAGVAFVLRQRRAANPLYDLRRRRAADLLGRRLRGHHRLRLADGLDVHRPAVPAGRARLRHARRRRGDPPGRDLDGARRPPVGQDGRASRRPLHHAHGLRFVLLGFLAMLLLWKEDIPYWKVGLAYALVGIGIGFAGTPASHSLTGSVPVKRVGHGVGHRRPPARSRRGDHAVDLRRAAGRRLRGGGNAAIAASPQASNVTSSVQSELTKSFAGAEPSRQQYRSTPTRSSPRPRRRSSRATSGPTWPASSPCCSARPWSPSASRSVRRRRRCWPPTTRPTSRRRRAGDHPDWVTTSDRRRGTTGRPARVAGRGRSHGSAPRRGSGRGPGGRRPSPWPAERAVTA